jgi:Taurine catabolism dioxygenase TauD, TfdA family
VSSDLPFHSPLGNQALPRGPVLGPAAWTASTLQQERDWIITLEPEELAEIDAAVLAHQRSQLGMGAISPRTFQLPRLASKLRALTQQLLQGRGFALLRGFDVAQHSIEASAIAYLGIGSHLGSFRSQNAKGHLLGHVRDLGMDIADPKVRYYQTNRALDYHTDSCDVVGLMCLKGAKSGGESKLVSSVTLHNEILKRAPTLWAALFNPYPTDRRGEIPKGMLPWFDIPIFNWYGGELSTLYVGQYIRSAQQLFPAARRLNSEELEAIDLLDQLADNDRLALRMEFRPGDMQFVHNHQILHSRTDFENWPDLAQQRHLFRLWLAPTQARALPQVYAQRYGSIEAGHRGGIFTDTTELSFSIEP